MMHRMRSRVYCPHGYAGLETCPTCDASPQGKFWHHECRGPAGQVGTRYISTRKGRPCFWCGRKEPKE